MAIVTIDLEMMKAKVTPVLNEKYARKLVNDKLKAETNFKGGWFVWSDYDNDPDKDGEHRFHLTNSYHAVAKAIRG